MIILLAYPVCERWSFQSGSSALAIRLLSPAIISYEGTIGLCHAIWELLLDYLLGGLRRIRIPPSCCQLEHFFSRRSRRPISKTGNHLRAEKGWCNLLTQSRSS